MATREINEAFEQIFMGILDEVNSTLENAVSQVVKSSAGYLSQTAHEAVASFQKLYFAGDEMESHKRDINLEVDDIFESVQKQLESGGEVDIKIEEDDEKKKARLALAASQKQLETLISVDSGVREKLVPVLESMGLAEGTTLRLENLSHLWGLLFSYLDPASEHLFLKMDGQCRAVLRSAAEQHLYYTIVRHEIAPTPPSDSSSILSSLL